MPRSVEILLVLFLSLVPGCISSVPRETIIVPAVAEFDVEFLRGLFSPAGIPILSRRNTDDGVSRFALDTGSEFSMITEQYATKMGFPSRCTVPYTVVGAENELKRAEGVVRIEELRFDNSRHSGSVAFREFDALVVDTPLFDSLGLQGILGAPLLAHCTFTIDFAANVLLIEGGSIDRNLTHTTPIHIAWGGAIHVRIEIAGETHWALLDTGSNGFLSVPEERWADLPLRDTILEGRVEGFSFNSASRSKFGQLDGCIVIAGQRIQNPFVSSNSRGAFSIGCGLLNGHALSIDQRSRLARLVASPRNAQATENESRVIAPIH